MVTLRRTGRLQRQCKNEATPTKVKTPKEPPIRHKSKTNEALVKASVPVKRQTRKRKGAPLLPSVNPSDSLQEEPPLDPPEPPLDPQQPLDPPDPIPEEIAKIHQTASMKRNTRSKKTENKDILIPKDNQDNLSEPVKTNVTRTKKDNEAVPLPPPPSVKYNHSFHNNEDPPSKQTIRQDKNECDENSVPSTPAMIEKEEILPSITTRKRRKSRVNFSASKTKKDAVKSENITPQTENIPPESQFQAPDSKKLQISNSKKKKKPTASVSPSQHFVVGLRRSKRVPVPVTPVGVKNNDDSGIADSITVETPQEEPKSRTMKQEKAPVLETTGPDSETSKMPKKSPKIISPSEATFSRPITKVYSSKQSHKRKQKVDADVESEVNKQIIDHSICSLLFKPKRKKKLDVMQPSFESISPIKTTKKLEELEKSMNLFQCAITPIVFDKKSPSSKNTPNKSLVKGKSASVKISEKSLLKTPIRNVFSRSKTDLSMNSSLFSDEYEMDSDEDEDDEVSVNNDDEYHVFKNITPKERVRKPRHTLEESSTMDYNEWLADHASDFSQYKDFDLVLE